MIDKNHVKPYLMIYKNKIKKLNGQMAFFCRSKCITLIISQNYFNWKKKKSNQIVLNNLSSNLYQDMLNNKLKRRLFSKSKLRE